MTEEIPQEVKDKAAAFCKERSLPLGSERRAAAYSGFIAGYLAATKEAPGRSPKPKNQE